MRCSHCHQTVPARGYCCERAELQALRTVTDEVAAMLRQEITTSAASIGGMDAIEPFALAAQRLLTARGRAA